ncbi:MAG: hypothetical protein DWQ08_13520 [Proteobacteria bacterium]|nr:MAG: hypothetical protein DWQ08_13520 [Pseudomonadota bacterium]
MPDGRISQKEGTPTLWRSLFYFNIYRLVLSCVLVALAVSGDSSSGAPHRYPDIFLLAAGTIMALAGLYFFTINSARPRFQVQVHAQTVLDLVLLSILIHASDGIQSGYGFLMIVTVAAVSLMDTRQSAIAYAALGTLLAFAETFAGLATGFNSINALRSPGFLGAGLFSTALVVSRLSQRIRVSEEIASRRESALANVNALNREIVELIPTGALAIDDRQHVLVCNERARTLLRLTYDPEGRPLEEVSPALRQRLEGAFGESHQSLAEFQFKGSTIKPSTEPFGNGRLVFLEDLSHERERSRQVRLAALGRLAAAIAHEIRNPLSAVYQSAQLLTESPTLDKEDANIAAIICKQSERIERVISSVLDVSRGGGGAATTIDLLPWLRQFARQFATEHDLDDASIAVDGDGITATIDPDHLTQVLNNLCENAIAHVDHDGGELCRLTTRVDPASGIPTLEITDYGAGIPENHHKQLFEPFFTTRSQGTGLGLYIARELCEANHARLSFEPDRENTVFKITFFSRPHDDVEAGAGH